MPVLLAQPMLLLYPLLSTLLLQTLNGVITITITTSLPPFLTLPDLSSGGSKRSSSSTLGYVGLSDGGSDKVEKRYYSLDMDALNRLCHRAAVVALLKAKSTSLLHQIASMGHAIKEHASDYAYCRAGAKTAVDHARCVVRLLDARDHHLKVRKAAAAAAEQQYGHRPPTNLSTIQIIRSSRRRKDTSTYGESGGSDSVEEEKPYLGESESSNINDPAIHSAIASAGASMDSMVEEEKIGEEKIFFAGGDRGDLLNGLQRFLEQISAVLHPFGSGGRSLTSMPSPPYFPASPTWLVSPLPPLSFELRNVKINKRMQVTSTTTTTSSSAIDAADAESVAATALKTPPSFSLPDQLQPIAMKEFWKKRRRRRRRRKRDELSYYHQSWGRRDGDNVNNAISSSSSDPNDSEFATSTSTPSISSNLSSTSTTTTPNLANIQRLHHYLEKKRAVEAYIRKMNEQNSAKLRELLPEEFSSIHYRIFPRGVRAGDREKEGEGRSQSPAGTTEKNEDPFFGPLMKFRRLSILSPRLFPLFKKKTKSPAASSSHHRDGKAGGNGMSSGDGVGVADRLSILSPEVLSLGELPSSPNQQPTSWENGNPLLAALNETEQEAWLELLLEMSGVGGAVREVLNASREEIEAMDNVVYPAMLELTRLDEQWDHLTESFSPTQQLELESSGYTHLDDEQLRTIYQQRLNPRGNPDMVSPSEQPPQPRLDYFSPLAGMNSAQREHHFEEQIRRLASLMEINEAKKGVNREGDRSYRAKRHAKDNDERNASSIDGFFDLSCYDNIHNQLSSQEIAHLGNHTIINHPNNETTTSTPSFLHTNGNNGSQQHHDEHHQSHDHDDLERENGELLLLTPWVGSNWVGKPVALETIILSPHAFLNELASPEALVFHLLSPRAFISSVLSPNALIARVLSPAALRAEILSPRALTAFVLTPEALIAEVLSPRMLDTRVLSPELLIVKVLSPIFLTPKVYSPEWLGITVLSPSILSPKVMSGESLMIEIISPSILSGGSEEEKEKEEGHGKTGEGHHDGKGKGGGHSSSTGSHTQNNNHHHNPNEGTGQQIHHHQHQGDHLLFEDRSSDFNHQEHPAIVGDGDTEMTNNEEENYSSPAEIIM